MSQCEQQAVALPGQCRKSADPQHLNLGSILMLKKKLINICAPSHQWNTEIAKYLIKINEC